MRKNLCKIYYRLLVKSHDCIQGGKSDVWVHRECNKINKRTHNLLQKDHNSTWYSTVCTKDFLPFSKLNDEELIYTIKGKKKLKLIHLALRHV